MQHFSRVDIRQFREFIPMLTSEMPLITIILTTLNSERYLAHSIESCLNQTYKNFELIIVDGGSVDRTLEIAGAFNDERIRIVHQQKNTGKLPGAINLGMANAKGAMLTWTQDDCWYEPNALAVMAHYLEENPEVALVYTDYWLIDLIQDRVLYREVKTPQYILEEDVVQTCFLFRRQVYETIGPQDVRYYSVHEVPWRIKVAERFRIEPLHVPLQYYRLHPGSLTGRFGGYTEKRKLLWALLNEGHIQKPEYVRRLAEADIDEAFDMFVLQGDFRGFRKRALAGIAKDWHWCGNKGLWKMFAVSYLPHRNAYRQTMHDNWKTRETEQQANLISRYHPNAPQVTDEILYG